MNDSGSNMEKRSFEAFVNAIGSEIEQAQVRLISAANAQMLFGNYILYTTRTDKAGAAKSSRNWRRRYGSIIPKRKDIRSGIWLICASSHVHTH